MARTTSDLVISVLVNDYQTGVSLTSYIDTASAVTDRVRACATAKGITLSDTELELIERWLSAYFYTLMDPIYKRKKTERAEGEFYDRSYLDAAKALDPSGCVDAIMSGKRASVFWGGKPKSQQIDYEDRD